MSNNQRSKHAFISVVIALCLITASATYAWFRQEQLNQELVNALRRLDSASALRALAQGADPNARDSPPSKDPWWNSLTRKFSLSRRTARTTGPIALFVAIDWRWQEVAHESEFWLDSYTPANAPPQDPRVIAALLDNGASVTDTNEVGLTPLQVAAWEGMSDTVRLLLKRGASVNACGLHKSHNTPLMLAIYGDDLPTIKVLLEHHADTRVIRGEEGWTALELAEGRENPAMFQLIKKVMNEH